jgi:hypothetical protein
MKIKTAEAKDAALDWLVTKCEGNTNGWCGMVVSRPMSYIFRPSTNWAQGGPIIERERISITHQVGRWAAQTDDDLFAYGPTPLIAAMRCYVASKLGDEVEIPEELMETNHGN